MAIGSASPVASSPDRIDASADYLQLRQHHEHRIFEKGRKLEHKYSRAPARERATFEAVNLDLQALKPPGLFAGKNAKAEREARLARLRVESEAALRAEANVNRQLVDTRAPQAEATR